MALYALSLLLHLLLAPFVIHDWDGYVFVEATRAFLDGTTPYAAVEAGPPNIYVGDAVPVVNSWYAYPPVALLLMAPSFALVTALWAAPWAERLAIKLPFILGDLVLAFVAAALVREMLKDDPEKAARRAAWVEKALLLNPFLIFISAAWGMFDALIVLFLLASVLLVLKERPAWAGVCFALACLVKPFPVVLGPLFLGFVGARLGWRRAAPAFVGAGAAAGLLLCLPFLLDAPLGFLQMTLLNHAQRPPQGFTLVGVPLAFGWVSDVTGIPLPRHVRPETLSQASFLLLATLALLLSTRMLGLRDPRRLLHLSLCMMVGTLLVSKVVNEQYFVLPVALAAVAFAAAERPLHRWLHVAYTWGGVVSGVWLGWHFVTFLPVDVAYAVLPVDPLEAVPRVMQAFGWDGHEGYLYTTLIGAVALVPACLLSLRLVLPEVASAARDLLARRGPSPAPRWFAAGAVALLLAVPLGAGLLAARDEAQAPPAATPHPEGPLVAALYQMRWHNPAHDPRIEYGNWREGVAQVPLEGYYTVSAGKIRNDFRAMKEAGVGLVVVAYGEHLRPKLPAVARLAEDEGLLFALQVDLGTLREREAHQATMGDGTPSLSLRAATQRAVADVASAALDDVARSPALWRVGDRPVVLFAGADRFLPDAEGEVRTRLTQEAQRLALDRPDLAPANASPAAIAASYPAAAADLSGASPYAALWRLAQDAAWQSFWRDVRDRLEARHGGLHLLGGASWDPALPPHRGLALSMGALVAFNGTYLPSPEDAWAAHADATPAQRHARWAERLALQAHHARAAGGPFVVAVSPAHDARAAAGPDALVMPPDHEGGATYRRAWEDAIALRPDVVLVDSWNEFHRGTAIEPTREHGHRFLDETREMAARLREAPRGPGGDAPRVLLVTNLRGASFEPGVADPDWTWALSVSLLEAARRLWGPGVEAVEWNGAAARVDLARYDLVVVEPGAGRALAPEADAFTQRVLDHARDGGTVLLLGSQVSGAWGRLAPWTEGDVLEGARLALPDGAGTVALDASDRTRVHSLPPPGRVHLWMENGTRSVPAAWTFPQGAGVVAVTAFKPQGHTTVEARHLEALRAVAAPLLARGA